MNLKVLWISGIAAIWQNGGIVGDIYEVIPALLEKIRLKGSL